MPRAFTPAESARIRARLLSVGREQTATIGLRKTSVASIAARAGISKGGFYLFFPSKEALWIAIVQEVETELRARLLAIADDATRDGEARLRAILTLFFDALREHPMLRALTSPDEFAWLLRALPPEALAGARDDDERFYRKLHRRLRRRGLLGEHVSVRAFTGLPAAALALLQGRALFGDDAHFKAFLAFQLDAWVARLTSASP